MAANLPGGYQQHPFRLPPLRYGNGLVTDEMEPATVPSDYVSAAARSSTAATSTCSDHDDVAEQAHLNSRNGTPTAQSLHPQLSDVLRGEI